MSVLTTKPKFLYPHSRQFPFDETAEKIVRAIEKRNWKVPGITVKFHTYGSGEAKYQMVSYISGDNFKLFFCRIQGHLDGYWNDTAALHEVCIPKQILEVYGDESGPSYYLYVGKDWEAEKQWFMNSTKVNSKLNKEPRRYLRYTGNTYKQRAKELVADNDLGREYEPKDDEPIRLNLNEIFKEFNEWLEENVLQYILNFPESDNIEPPIKMEELIPYNGPWSVVFSMCDGREAERLMDGKKNPNELPIEKRHASFGSRHRLVPLSVESEEKLPEIAYNGFIWCDVNQNITPYSKKKDISGSVCLASYDVFGPNFIVAIRPKYANNIYVVDDSKYTEVKRQLFESIAPRDRLTDEELGEVLTARGATIIPITEYEEDYEKPIVLINRELDFDEIEWLVKLEEKY